MAVAIAVALLAGVVAVVLVSGSDGDTDPPAIPEAGSEDLDLEAPTELTADRAAFRIQLEWQSGGGNIKVYRITRNGEVVASVSSDRTHWLDTDVFPDSRYRYAVRAVDAFGVPSDPATIAVRTPGAPLALSRVEGLYDVKLIVESKFGYGSFPSRATTGWRFVPVCDEGPCDVDWRDTTSHELTARLNRKGANYEGSDSGRFNIECGSHPVVSTLTVRLHVTRAKVVGDSWRASSLEGHLTQRESAQLGCQPSGVDYSVRAVLYT